MGRTREQIWQELDHCEKEIASQLRGIERWLGLIRRLKDRLSKFQRELRQKLEARVELRAELIALDGEEGWG